MRRLSYSLLALPLLGAVACGGSSSGKHKDGGADGGDACGGCGPGLGCDPASLTCVPGRGEGESCADPGAVCASLLRCDHVAGNALVCSRDCTAENGGSVCKGGTCLARPSGGGFCGRLAADGESCNNDALIYCSGTPLICVTNGSSTAGYCFPTCDPTKLDVDCSGGRSCADLWLSQPTRGICVTPVGLDQICANDRFMFCARGQACARVSGAPDGYCHTRCGGSSPCNTTAGEQCVQPFEGSTLALCVVPVARDQPCDAKQDKFCGVSDVCTPTATGSFCKQTCSATVPCPTGKSCVSATPTHNACL